MSERKPGQRLPIDIARRSLDKDIREMKKIRDPWITRIASFFVAGDIKKFSIKKVYPYRLNEQPLSVKSERNMRLKHQEDLFEDLDEKSALSPFRVEKEEEGVYRVTSDSVQMSAKMAENFVHYFSTYFDIKEEVWGYRLVEKKRDQST